MGTYVRDTIAIGKELDRFFDESSLAESGPPTAVVIVGSIAAGKTTLRRAQYAEGYTLIDAAQIFHNLWGDNLFPDFPGEYQQAIELIGRMAAMRALEEQRNIVTEILGDQKDETEELFSVLRAVGYKLEMVGVTCDLDEAIRRNENRGDNVSAYHSQQYQIRWLTEAGMNFIRDRDARGLKAMQEFLQHR